MAIRRPLLRSLSLLVLAIAAIASGCSGSGKDGGHAVVAATTAPAEAPDAFLKRVLAYGYEGKLGKMWEELHPAVRAIVSRDRYVECSSRYESPVELVSVKTLAVSDEAINAPGIPEKTTKTVSLSLTVEVPGQTPFAVVSTLHALEVDGRWVWIPKPGALRAYREGRCPTAQDEDATS